MSSDVQNSEPEELYRKFHRNARPMGYIPSKSDYTYGFTVEMLESAIGRAAIPVRSVLDLGCGTGPLSFCLAQRCDHVLGVDISAQAIDSCEQGARALGIDNVEFRVGRLEDIEDGLRFDMIVCSEVLEHLPDDSAALRHLFKMLLPGGVLVLSTPSINAPIHRLRMHIVGKDVFDERVGHLRRYTRSSIVRVLHSAHFEVVDLRLWEGIVRNFLFVTRLGVFIGAIVRRLHMTTLISISDSSIVEAFGESDIFVIATRGKQS